jgi:hypothetical protein
VEGVVSGSLKIVLLVLAGLGLLLVAGVLGFAWWLNRNMDELRSTAEATQALGAEFGQGRAASACVVEAIARVDRCDGMICELGEQRFLAGCLGVALTPPDFCREVPKNDEILASVKYRLQVCLAHEARDQEVCSRLLDAVQSHCHPGTR